MRLIAVLGHYLATTDQSGVQIHQYATVTLTTDVATLQLDTAYPHEGQVAVTITEVNSPDWTFALRIPDWCSGVVIRVNDEAVDAQVSRSTYAELSRRWQTGDVVELDLLMTPQLIEGHPRIDSVRGCLALQRGPLIYCLEGIDQPEGVDLLDVYLPANATFETTWQADLLDGVNTIATTGGLAEVESWADMLYRPITETASTLQSVPLTAVPYYAWANRGGGTMRVWIPKQTR